MNLKHIAFTVICGAILLVFTFRCASCDERETKHRNWSEAYSKCVQARNADPNAPGNCSVVIP